MSIQGTPVGSGLPSGNGDASRPKCEAGDLHPIAQGSTPVNAWKIRDVEGREIDLTTKSLRLVLSTFDDETRLFTPAYKYETGSGITVCAGSRNEVRVRHSAEFTANVGRYHYWLWNVTNGVVMAAGWVCVVAATKDTIP